MTTTFGEVHRHGDRFDLGFERLLATGIEDAWSAVTEPGRLARWMARYDGELRLGGTWQAYSDDGNPFVRGEVTACDAPHTFTTTWHAVEEEPTELVVTLAEVEGGTRLTLRHTGVQSVMYGAGWQTYLEQLDDELGALPGSEVDASRAPGVGWDERFAQLSPLWRERIERA